MEGYRILIVEDHVQSRTTMAEYLRRQEGVALVREAGNGAEALKLLSEEPFEIMITDIIMPQMHGYALLEEMRRRELPSKPQTIVVSALGRDDFVTRAIELGATFYMVKPFDMRHLMSHIRDLSGGRIRPADAAPTPRETHRVQTLDERLGSLFLTIGIPAHIKGYQFLRQAVKMVVD